MRKICSFCKINKQITEFFKNKRRKDGLQTYCKSCKAGKDHEYYFKHKQLQQNRVRRYLLKNKKKVWKYLDNHPCVDCGENNPIVLEFDHRENTTKREAISYLINYSKCSWNTLLDEISKCDIRCANCHRIKTAKQLGWYKFI